jgi:hypothetical protein
MVLHHVPQRSGTFIVAPAVLDAEVLGHGDRDVVDVSSIPDRLEHGIREPERQHVLHGLLAEEVVDAENLSFQELLRQRAVDFAERREVVAQRLLHHDPAVLPVLSETRLGQPAGNGAEERGRRRQVEHVVRRSLPTLPGGGEPFMEALVCLLGIEVGLKVIDLGGEALPRGAFRSPTTGKLVDPLAQAAAQTFVVVVSMVHADQGETLGQTPIQVQVDDGRADQAPRQIAGSPE